MIPPPFPHSRTLDLSPPNADIERCCVQVADGLR